MSNQTTVLVRFFASARTAAGTDQEWLSLSAPATIADAITTLAQQHPNGLPKVLDAASFLLDGVAVRDRAQVLPDRAGLDVLPPFAGG